jgi:hypothetical protein
MAVQMCDALTRNVPRDFAVILANSLAHARRQFVDAVPVCPWFCPEPPPPSVGARCFVIREARSYWKLD